MQLVKLSSLSVSGCQKTATQSTTLITKPILHLLFCLRFNLFSNVGRDSRNCCYQNTKIISKSKCWHDIRNCINRENEISKGTINHSLCPSRSCRVLGCIVKPKCLFNHLLSRRLRKRNYLFPESLIRVLILKIGHCVISCNAE